VLIIGLFLVRTCGVLKTEKVWTKKRNEMEGADKGLCELIERILLAS
jgi:hypothetical protein